MSVSTKTAAVLAIAMICCASVAAETLNFSSQTSGWVTMKRDDKQFGFRFIPELSWKTRLSTTYELSAEAAGNALWAKHYAGWDHENTRSTIDPYRLWLRFGAPQYELRAGLQKINFGPATLLRPLRWFDSVDPRDPLNLTDGVYGLLGRYYYLNNANIWAWALWGNDSLKGWETIPSDKRKVEFGGRAQMPVRKGEMAVSFHQRRVNPDGSLFGAHYPAHGEFTEQRIGLDGKWDVGVGVWFEGTVTRRDVQTPIQKYTKLLTVGTDYTFPVGNGPHLLIEHLVRNESKNAFGLGDRQSTSALSADYPLSLLDTVSTVVYYDWEKADWSRYVTLRRTHDTWQVHFSAFWNPDQTGVTNDGSPIAGLGGRGVQVMLVFNR